MDKDWEIQQKHFGSQLNEALKQYDQNSRPQWVTTDQSGKIATVKLNPGEIQEDFECEPESGSYMSVDDDMKRQAAVELDQVALQSNGLLDMEKVLINHLKTIKGIDDPESFLAPPKPPSPPPPKINITLSGKIEDIPSLANAILQELGLPPSADLEEQSQLNTLKRVSQAADHATNLLAPADPRPEGGPLGAAEGESAA
jgi:hypothetical protein